MTTLKVERAEVGLGFWLRWMWVSVLGLGLGSAVGGPIIVAGTLYADLGGYELGGVIGAVAGCVGGTILGMVAGIAQRTLMRRYVVGAWVRASMAGYALSFAALTSLFGLASTGWAGFCFPNPDTGEAGNNCPAIPPVLIDLSLIPGVASGILGGMAIGVVAGTMQWLVLRRCFSRAGWWVLASIVGWAVATTTVGFILASDVSDFAHRISSSWFWVSYAPWYVVMAAVLAGVSLYAAVSGTALVWLLRQPRSGIQAGTVESGALKGTS